MGGYPRLTRKVADVRAASDIGAAQKQLIPYADADDPDQHILAGDILSSHSTEVLATMLVNFITN